MNLLLRILVFLLIMAHDGFAEENPDTGKLQGFNSIYFISGEPDTKIQLSFKYQLLDSLPVYFGYNQVMFWRLLREKSSPFSDINFHPELFYRYRITRDAYENLLDAGYSHSSNGRDGGTSRSFDSIFFRVRYLSRDSIGINPLQFTFRFIFNLEETNEDLREFVGPVVLDLHLSQLLDALISTNGASIRMYTGGKFGEDFSRFSLEASFRFKVFHSNSAPRLYFQYFNGYGEALAHYNTREQSYRAGLSLAGDELATRPQAPAL